MQLDEKQLTTEQYNDYINLISYLKKQDFKMRHIAKNYTDGCISVEEINNDREQFIKLFSKVAVDVDVDSELYHNFYDACSNYLNSIDHLKCVMKKK